jgi:hypothetical protein
MTHSSLIPALTAKAHALSLHMGQLVDTLPARAQTSMPSRQAYFSAQLLEEQMQRAERAITNTTYHAALLRAMAEARSAGFWIHTLAEDMPETARLCATVSDEADSIAMLLAEASY